MDFLKIVNRRPWCHMLPLATRHHVQTVLDGSIKTIQSAAVSAASAGLDAVDTLMYNAIGVSKWQIGAAILDRSPVNTVFILVEGCDMPFVGMGSALGLVGSVGQKAAARISCRPVMQ